jgi:hypothetical protein
LKAGRFASLYLNERHSLGIGGIGISGCVKTVESWNQKILSSSGHAATDRPTRTLLKVTSMYDYGSGGKCGRGVDLGFSLYAAPFYCRVRISGRESGKGEQIARERNRGIRQR